MKNGEAVIYRQNDYFLGRKDHKAKFIRYISSTEARIKFDDPNLLPQRMDVPIEKLYIKNDIGNLIPIPNPNLECECGTPWEERHLFRTIIEMCPKCDKRKPNE